MSEKGIQAAVFDKLNRRPDVRVFRNNVGVGFQGRVRVENPDYVILENHRRVRFGLMDGSGDLIGWKTIEITQSMVGNHIAVFTSLEIKTPIGFIKPEQKNWIVQVTKAGGIAKIIRSADEANLL